MIIPVIALHIDLTSARWLLEAARARVAAQTWRVAERDGGAAAVEALAEAVARVEALAEAVARVEALAEAVARLEAEGREGAS